MVTAHINPTVLRWAMARADVGTEDLGKSFKKTPEMITAWMDGAAAPTFKQAQRLAKKLRVPFGYLFLEAPPPEELPLPDFRRPNAGARREPSLDLRDVISDVLRKQDWYRDFRLDREEGPLPFVGSFTLNSPAVDVAGDIKNNLRFEAEIRPESQASQFLRAFVRQVEALGLLVMRNGIVRQATKRALDVEEFRGFSIADPIAPVIFINNADSNAAQAFTLAHELAHIWIGLGGISDADLTLAGEGDEGVEAFCNEVAGELLLPWARLEVRWRDRVAPTADWIAVVAKDFHVSSVMVARQLWVHDLVSREQFFQLYQAEKAKWITQGAESTGGNFYLSAPIRNSRLLTEAVLESVNASETSIRDAARLLGVKPANLPKLGESMGVG